MQEYTLKTTIEGKPDMTFEGQVLAEVTSEESGRDQYMILRLYQTERGKVVFEQITAGTKPHDLHDFRVFQNIPAFLRRVRRTSMIDWLIREAGVDSEV